MSRKERKNMIEFIQKVRQLDKELFMYMTDADIEHIYNSIYTQHEMIME